MTKQEVQLKAYETLALLQKLKGEGNEALRPKPLAIGQGVEPAPKKEEINK